MAWFGRGLVVWMVGVSCVAGLGSRAMTSQQIPVEVQNACAADVQKLCSNVQTGGGRIIACLKQNQAQVSNGCKQAVMKAMQQAQGGAAAAGNAGTSAATSAAAPAGAYPATSAASGAGTAAGASAGGTTSPAVRGKSGTSTTVAKGSAGNYVVMKQVQLIDQSSGQPKPAYDLLVPTSWQFKGWVNVKVAEGGCFADWFSTFADAKSADNSIEFEILPQYTWQYISDPTGQRQMQAQNQQDQKYGMKPCPVQAPITAAQFLQQDFIPQYYKGKTVVSILPYPELDQIVRSQMGLPASSAGGGTTTNAARARIESTDDKGQPVEIWVTAAAVVQPIAAGGASAFNWHMVRVMVLQAPKGQLDANDKLLTLIASTFHPDPAWEKYSNGVIAGLYNAKAQQLAKQSAMLAQFQAHVVQTINGVVANQQRGANNAAFGQDQLVRSVQTFRNPTTGATFELSNLYDHAWLNSSNEYVMSEDPNFNPNGKVDGNWTELQVVHPAP